MYRIHVTCTGFLTRLTLWEELLTLPEHLSAPPVFSGVRVTRSLVLCVCFVDRCLSFCPFLFWPLCCLFFFNLRILITPWYLQNLTFNCYLLTLLSSYSWCLCSLILSIHIIITRTRITVIRGILIDNTRTVESRMTCTFIITLYNREIKNIYQFERNLVELIVTIISWS